jgi:hypothetical protein
MPDVGEDFDFARALEPIGGGSGAGASVEVGLADALARGLPSASSVKNLRV